MNDLQRSCRYLARLPSWNRLGVLVWLGLLTFAMPFTARALTLGQLDDFQDGTALNWQTGVGPINNVATSGPGGAGDRYASYTSSGGFGANSRMIIFNSSQWLGDYVGAGINGIEMDLDNFSLQPLSMRIAFFQNSGTGYVTTTPFALSANSGWQHAIFSLTAAEFTAVGSPGDFNTFLSNSTQLRILSSSAPSLLGDAVAAMVGFDNIHAIPEPSTIAMAGVGLLALLCCRRSVQIKKAGTLVARQNP